MPERACGFESHPGYLSSLDEIDALAGLGPRAPGSDAERRAARHLEARLRARGRRAEIESLDAWPRWAPAYAFCAALSVVGSVLSVSLPVAGAAAAGAAAFLFLLDAGLLIPVVRRPLGRRASQNVVSWGERTRPGLIVLVAHYDAGRGGLALGRRLRRGLGARALLGAQLAVLACCLVRLAGPDGTALTAVQFVPTVALIVAVALLLDIAMSSTRSAENDQACGVVLALGERFTAQPLEHFDVDVLFTGAEKALAAGMRGFLRRHRAGLPKSSTVFINLDDTTPAGARYARREGPLFALKTPPQLAALLDSPPFVNRSPGDGYAARLRGFPVLTISGGDEAFCAALIARLDAELGPRVSSNG